MYTPLETRQEPVQISGQQARSIARILNKAGRPCDLTTVIIDGEPRPAFVGVSSGEVAAAAHYIDSLAGLPWLKIILAEEQTSGEYFASTLLRWRS